VHLAILEKAYGIVMRARKHSMKVAVRPSSDSSSLAASVVLLTGFGADPPVRTDALLSCVVPPAGHHGPLEGNYLYESSPGGDWVLELTRHKTMRSHGPLRVVYRGGSLEARVFLKWRAFLYSPECPPSPAPQPSTSGRRLAPLLLKPLSLQPIPAHNWAPHWQWSLNSMAYSLAGRNALSSSDLELVSTGTFLPSGQQHLRHLYASLQEVRLLEEQEEEVLSPASLDERREALAWSMGSSLALWKQRYSAGFKFWQQVDGFDSLSSSQQRAHVERVLRLCMADA
jgi:hypothetical protein